MAFDQRFLDELIARNDIVDVVSNYVTLQKKGANYFGLCPFHNEKTGSFSVSPDKQICYCFGCKKGGGVINFIMEEEHLTFPDAVRFLARRANMPIPEETHSEESRLRARILALNRDAARFYYDQLHTPAGAEVLAYMNDRRITQRNATNFGLGAAGGEWTALTDAMRRRGYGDGELLASGLSLRGKSGGLYDKFRSRLIFPIIDVRGDVLGFGGRIVRKDDPGAKYMNTPETVVYSKRRVLYGLNLAKKSKRGSIILVEGNIDVVMLHQAGFDNACASMGTALTGEQLQLLSRYTKELILCYDNDDAGKTATQKALTLLNDTDFQVKVLELPRRLVDGQYIKQDADDFIKYQGRDAFEHLLTGSESGMDFRMAQLAGKFDLSGDEGRIGYAEAAASLLATLDDTAITEIYTTAGSRFKTVCIQNDLHLLDASVRHLGTDINYVVLENIYNYLKDKVTFYFDTPVQSIHALEQGYEVRCKDEGYTCDKCIVSVGRSGSKWMEQVCKDMKIHTKSNRVDIGVRVELPAAVFAHLTDELYESKIVYRTETYGDLVRTFCMNPKGAVVNENTNGIITVNGHSYEDPAKQTENTNFALLVAKHFSEPFKDSNGYGESIARLSNMLGGGVIVQRFGDLIRGRRSTPNRIEEAFITPTLSATPGDLSLVLPKRILDGIIEMIYALDKVAPGTANDDTLLYGVEVKFYNMEVDVNENLECCYPGLYIIGDGSGITHSLSHASASGVHVARNIVNSEAK